MQGVIEDWLNQHSSFQLPGDAEAVVFPLTFMPQHQQASVARVGAPPPNPHHFGRIGWKDIHGCRFFGLCVRSCMTSHAADATLEWWAGWHVLTNIRKPECMCHV